MASAHDQRGHGDLAQPVAAIPALQIAGDVQIVRTPDRLVRHPIAAEDLHGACEQLRPRVETAEQWPEERPHGTFVLRVVVVADGLIALQRVLQILRQ